MNLDALEDLLPDTCLLRGSRESGCVVSSMEHYRYALWRFWDLSGLVRPMIWCMLNPSKADHTLDDPTIRKCRGFAMRLGYPGFVVVNLFGFRATRPESLLNLQMSGAVGMGYDNDLVMEAVARATGAKRLWCAWGASLPQLVRPRVQELRPFLESFSLLCLGTSKDGSPRHPLMLGYRTEPRPWVPPKAAA